MIGRQGTHRIVVGGLVCVLSLVVTPAVSSASASAAPDDGDGPGTTRVLRPDGSVRGDWSLRQSTDGTELRWKARQPLPMTSARPEVRAGNKVLGYPSIGTDGQTLTLADVEVADAKGLQVWLGARRLDGPTPRVPSGSVPEVTNAVARDVGIDPAKPGPHESATFDYRYAALPWKPYPGDIEVLGQAVLPKGVDDAPLVVLLHGRHEACYRAKPPVGDVGSLKWPCPGSSKPVPSYRGYTYLQKRLASQGYATVSISANGINQQDFRDSDGGARARSKLVRHHLRLLAERSSRPGNRWSGRLEMDRVLLVGHSRGGEGVNQAVVDTGAAEPYSVVGQFLLAPTDFSQHTAGYTPTAVALPYCDGDVSDLQGQRFVEASIGLAPDDTALRSSVLVRGANHNFFNTEWTPGLSIAPSIDDWYEPQHKVCGSKASQTRLTPKQQRKVGLTLTTAAARAFVHHDARMLRVLDAPGALTTTSMGKKGVVWSHAIGAARRSLRPGEGATVAGAANVCLATGAIDKHGDLRLCADGLRNSERAVHWQQALPTVLTRDTLREARLDWKRSGRAGGFDFDTPLDLSSSDESTLDLRMIATAKARAVRIRLRDSAGQTWSQRVRVQRLVGGDWLRPQWAQTVRVDPAAAPASFDEESVESVRIVSDSPEGVAWLVDASVRTPDLPAVPDRSLPRLHLRNARVTEGDGSGSGVAEVPFRLRGPVSEPSKFDVMVTAPGGHSRLVRVNMPAGERTGTFAVRYDRNEIDDRDARRFQLTAQAVSGVALARYQSRLAIRDDDPSPKLTVTPKRKAYRVGEVLKWQVRISDPVGYTMEPMMRLKNVKGVRTLRGTDVAEAWWRNHAMVGDRKDPLSFSVRRLYVRIPKGSTTSGTLRIPTIRAARRPPRKALRGNWFTAHHKGHRTVAVVRPPKR